MIPGLPPYNNADEIIPGLWLGNAHASMDETFLKNAKIQVVFNCTKDLPFHSSIRRRYRVPVHDNLEKEEIRNMELWSYEIVLKMYHEYNEGRSILVHCMAGMQRSPAAIAMFLIATQRMMSEQAKAFIRQKRPIAFYPSANFGESIEGFEESLNKSLIKQSL
jgi:protein tyrosine phosphatase